jgi:hypothetical protein
LYAAVVVVVVVVVEVVADAVVADWPIVAAACVIEDGGVDAAAAWDEVRPCDVDNEGGRSDRGGGLSGS